MGGAGTVLGGRYRLIEKIGGGAMGSVWRAEDTVLARQVAVKILRSELFEDGTAAQRFRREAQLVAAIDHPGVVHVHDYGEGGADGDERCAYIVMELIDGRPLDRVLADTGPMGVERTLDLVAGALDALHAAHRRDIVHRDVKPSNLMVRTDGRVTVTDFGIARALASTKLTAPFAIIGTALYMSPEQAEGAALGPATDLYSIGVVCYELLVGEPPFTGDGPLQIALKHVNQPVPELPETFPVAVRALVARALAKKPEERFADAAAMAAAARAAIRHAGGVGRAGGVAGGPGGGTSGPAGSGTIALRPGAVPVTGGKAGGAPAAEAGAGAATPDAAAGTAAGGTPAKGPAVKGPAVKGVTAEGAGAEGGQAGAVPGAGAGSGDEDPPKGAAARDEVAKLLPQAPTEAGRRRPRRTLLVPVIIPVIISAGTATALLIDRSPGGSDAAAPPAAQPTVVVTVPANPASGSPAAAATTAPVTPPPSDTPAATPSPDQSAPGAQNQQPPPVAVPAQGGAGGTSGGARAGGTGATSGGGASGGSAVGGQANQSAGGAGGNPPAPPVNQNPQPPAQTSGGATTAAPQGPSRPSSCGGTSWSTVVSVKEDRPIGMRNDSLTGGNPIVLGGATQYGWVRATNPGAWILFNACNNGGPQLVQTPDGKVELSSGFSYLTNWTVRSGSTAGSYTLADYMNSVCMTSNGPGNAVTMVACTPGNTAQEWRFQ
ncbi:serine/threonine-protein kinase [Kitasatospora sp. NPDC059599]|uniref:serine/threonine-protein kinase n=1 Tax=Kitasatospora sp. NPDC059599 TaxID=3346880 RepID=UPI00369BE817